MIDAYTLKMLARVSLGLFLAGALCTIAQWIAEWANKNPREVPWEPREESPGHWRFTSRLLTGWGMILACLVSGVVAAFR